MIVVCGIDLAAGRGITAVATLDVPEDGGEPRFRQELPTTAADDAGVLRIVRAAAPVGIAIDAPLTLPAPVAAVLRGQSPPESSPYLRAAERDPLWSTIGVRPLPVSFLGGLTFRALVLRARLAAELPETWIVETYPTAVLRLLAIADEVGHAGRRAKKSTLEARVVAQRALCPWIANLPSPEPEPLGADLLDALAAVLTAVAVLRGTSVAVGDPAEGQIVLPARSAIVIDVPYD